MKTEVILVVGLICLTFIAVYAVFAWWMLSYTWNKVDAWINDKIDRLRSDRDDDY
jgi:hypothetical protein